jgi:flagella basal body P-ring formation protein FlgA
VRVPLQLQLFRTVLVASHPLLRGDGLREADVRAEERDITRLGYGHIENLGQVAGRTLNRAMASGSVLTPGALGGRRMVRAGDHVQMVARLGGIEVRADGVALGSGDNGARLRVRNESSGKVVDAMVSAPGEVLALP